MQSYQSETSHSSHIISLKHSERGMLNFNTSELVKRNLNCFKCQRRIRPTELFFTLTYTYLLTYVLIHILYHCVLYMIYDDWLIDWLIDWSDLFAVYDMIFVVYRETTADRQRHRSPVHPSVRFLWLGSAAEQNSSFTSSGSIRSSSSSLRVRQWQEEYFRRTGGRGSLRITTGEIS